LAGNTVPAHRPGAHDAAAAARVVQVAAGPHQARLPGAGHGREAGRLRRGPCRVPAPQLDGKRDIRGHVLPGRRRLADFPVRPSAPAVPARCRRTSTGSCSSWCFARSSSRSQPPGCAPSGCGSPCHRIARRPRRERPSTASWACGPASSADSRTRTPPAQAELDQTQPQQPSRNPAASIRSGHATPSPDGRFAWLPHP
jgi:hypothetical protein